MKSPIVKNISSAFVLSILTVASTSAQVDHVFNPPITVTSSLFFDPISGVTLSGPFESFSALQLRPNAFLAISSGSVLTSPLGDFDRGVRRLSYGDPIKWSDFIGSGGDGVFSISPTDGWLSSQHGYAAFYTFSDSGEPYMGWIELHRSSNGASIDLLAIEATSISGNPNLYSLFAGVPAIPEASHSMLVFGLASLCVAARSRFFSKRSRTMR